MLTRPLKIYRFKIQAISGRRGCSMEGILIHLVLPRSRPTLELRQARNTPVGTYAPVGTYVPVGTYAPCTGFLESLCKRIKDS